MNKLQLHSSYGPEAHEGVPKGGSGGVDRKLTAFLLRDAARNLELSKKRLSDASQRPTLSPFGFLLDYTLLPGSEGYGLHSDMGPRQTHACVTQRAIDGLSGYVVALAHLTVAK